jgi:hypothetical protein
MFLLCTVSVARGAGRAAHAGDVPLVQLALARFHTLTRAERALLEFADVDNTERGVFAVCGSSGDPADPSNDPKHSDEWTHDRDVRAPLIRWLAVNRATADRIDPKGLRALGARIVGPLDLAQVRVPFPIALVRSSIPAATNLDSAEIPSLDLQGSYTGEINAVSLNAHSSVNLSGEFHASGVVNLSLVKADEFNFAGGHFQYSERPSRPFGDPALKMALVLFSIESKGDVTMCCGFESHGGVLIDESTIDRGDLNCSGGRFINPGTVALSASGARISGAVIMAPHSKSSAADPLFGFGSKAGFLADGFVNFASAHVGDNFVVADATFGGRAGEGHGLFAVGISVQSFFVWQDVRLENGAIDDLSGANLGILLDDERSWPQPHDLLIDGLTYRTLGGSNSYNPAWKSPVDPRLRIKWLGLQPEFHSQPYRQLARVLHENGDDEGAAEVLIAKEDARFRNSNWLRRAWARFLDVTVGYGHKPLRAILWSLGLILLGWLLVAAGARAGVMRRTWPEAAPTPSEPAYERLHPLLYSLDVFLPFVNLHQEHYWWPDADRSGDVAVLGQRLKISGSFLRFYLWTQLIAGWMLSAIFIAGVSGLMRSD